MRVPLFSQRDTAPISGIFSSLTICPPDGNWHNSSGTEKYLLYRFEDCFLATYKIDIKVASPFTSLLAFSFARNR